MGPSRAQQKHLEPLPCPKANQFPPVSKLKPSGSILDHKLNETSHSYESHKKQSEVDIQTITKQQYQETERTEARTEGSSNKQSVTEKYYQLPAKEKRATIQLPTETTGKAMKVMSK